MVFFTEGNEAVDLELNAEIFTEGNEGNTGGIQFNFLRLLCLLLLMINAEYFTEDNEGECNSTFFANFVCVC
jgi:hypothetical protein